MCTLERVITADICSSRFIRPPRCLSIATAAAGITCLMTSLWRLWPGGNLNHKINKIPSEGETSEPDKKEKRQEGNSVNM